MKRQFAKRTGFPADKFPGVLGSLSARSPANPAVNQRICAYLAQYTMALCKLLGCLGLYSKFPTSDEVEPSTAEAVWKHLVEGLAADLSPDFFLERKFDAWFEGFQFPQNGFISMLYYLLDEACTKRLSAIPCPKSREKKEVKKSKKAIARANKKKAKQPQPSPAPPVNPVKEELESDKQFNVDVAAKQYERLFRNLTIRRDDNEWGIPETIRLGELVSVVETVGKYLENRQWNWKREDYKIRGEVDEYILLLKITESKLDELKTLVECIHVVNYEDLMTRSRNSLKEIKISSSFSNIGLSAAKMAQLEEKAASGPPENDKHGNEKTLTKGQPWTYVGIEASIAEEDSEDSYDYDDDDESNGSYITREEAEGCANALLEEECTSSPLVGKKFAHGVRLNEYSAVAQEIRKRNLTVEEFKVTRLGGRSKMPCPHLGCPQPPYHYRDWRRAGYRCICGDKFSSLEILENHLSFEHEASFLKCEDCEFRSNRKCCMVKHYEDEHRIGMEVAKGNRKLYECRWGCGSYFLSKMELIRHNVVTGRECRFRNANITRNVRSAHRVQTAEVNEIENKFLKIREELEKLGILPDKSKTLDLKSEHVPEKK